jgi:hypothetical protein
MVRVMVDVLVRLNEEYLREILNLVPLDMSQLVATCLVLKVNQVEYRHLFKRIEQVDRKYHQYEFEFIRRKNEPRKYCNSANEGCPFCGHKAHRSTPESFQSAFNPSQSTD